jgi:hypothetical protein
MSWTIEIPWVIVATAGLIMCVRLFMDAVMDRRTARKFEVRGPARLLAEAGVLHHVWRLIISASACAAAWVSLLLIPAHTYLYPSQYARNYLWLAVTVAVVTQGWMEHRTRAKIIADIERDCVSNG